MSIDKQSIIGNAVAAVFEGLEGRQLMAAGWVSNHKLTIQGDNAADDIQVTLSKDGSELWTVINGATSARYNAQMIYAIEIDAGKGNNRVSVDPRITTGATVRTGSGNDLVYTGAGHDLISTGSGKDTINSGLGNDTIDAGGSNDKVNGGGGNDYVVAGSGNDSVSADGGTDRLFGRRGNDKFVTDRDDSVDGGAGHDLITKVSSFRVVDVVPSPNITQLDLINTETGQTIISNLRDGETLNLANLPRTITIVARAGKDVQSVYYSMNDGSLEAVDSSALLSMTYVHEGKPIAWTPRAGDFKLTVTPFAADNARGFMGEPKVLHFKVISGTTNNGGGSTNNGGTNNNGGSNSGGGSSNNGGSTNNGGTNNTGGSTNNGGSTTTTGGTTNNSALAPAISLVASANTVQVGQALHVDATATTIPGYDIEDARFHWDFGDAGARHNNVAGFNSAHVYDRPGTYTVRLTVTAPGGRVSTVTTSVTVTAPTINKTIYVSNSGNDSNDGLSTGSSVRSIKRAIQLAGNDSQVLIKRGETLYVDSVITITSKNLRLGTYGSGQSPKIVWNGTRQGRPEMFFIPAPAENIVASGLTFDSIYGGDTEQTGMVMIFHVGGKNVTVRDNTFLNVGYAINLNLQPTQFLAMDNSAPSETGIRDYFCWVEGRQIVITGNEAANSTREHIVRIWGAEKISLNGNTFSNLDRRGLGDARDTAKGAIVSQKGRFSYIANNELRGPAGVGPLAGTDGLNEKWARFKHSAVEGNVMHDATFFLQHGAENVTLRDNTFLGNNLTQVHVVGYDNVYGRGVVDLVIDHNVGINNGTTGNFLNVAGTADRITLTNNVYVAPYLQPGSFGTAAVSVAMSNLSAFRQINGNIWPAVGRGYTSTAMNNVGSDFMSPARWNAMAQVGDDQFVDVRLDGVSLLTTSMLARV